MYIIENNVDALNTITFQNRNKNYGAYVLRSAYGNTVFKSLGITVLIFAFFSAIAVMLNRTVDEDKKLYTGSNIVPPIEKIIEVEITHPKQTCQGFPPLNTHLVYTTAISTNIIDSTVNRIQENNPIEDFTAVNNAATDNNSGAGGNTDNASSDGGNSTLPNTEPMNIGSIDVIPHLDNLIPFLQHNLSYPERAKSEGISGKVYVHFVIDEEGKVERATVVKGLGYGLDEEVLRVVKMMPKWTPGIKNGKPVKVGFVQPISFNIQ